MKKVIYFSLMIMAMVAMASCSQDSPGKAATKYCGYIQSGDFDKFVEGIAFDEKVTPEQVKEQKEGLSALLKDKASKEFEKKGGLKNAEAISEEISEDGNSAKVKMKYTYGNGETEDQGMELIKKDGKWMMSMKK